MVTTATIYSTDTQKGESLLCTLDLVYDNVSYKVSFGKGVPLHWSGHIAKSISGNDVVPQFHFFHGIGGIIGEDYFMKYSLPW